MWVLRAKALLVGSSESILQWRFSFYVKQNELGYVFLL